MIVGAVEGPARLVIAGLAAVVAGAVNAIAGGGTLLTFPTLIALGVNPVMANATNTLALFPGSLAGAVGFRRELGRTAHWLRMLLPPSLLGGAAGAVLLLHTSPDAVPRDLAVPGAAGRPGCWRCRTGTARASCTSRPRRRRGGGSGPCASSSWSGVYGGFFGAGIGILMLAALGALGVGNIHEMNGLKNVLAMSINVVAAVYFAASGAIVWSFAAVMAVGGDRRRLRGRVGLPPVLARMWSRGRSS